MTDTRSLIDRIERGPILLLLGQSYLESHDGFDPFVSAIATHIDAAQTDYDALLHSEPSDRASLQLWMARLCDHIQPPSWLTPLLDTPWNAVYTSAIDTVFRLALRNSWRDVQPVADDRYRPANPRNPATLAFTHLFGAVGEADGPSAAPTSPVDLLKRRPVATALLRRVVEDLTPLGNLLIVGYDPESDWLRPQELAAVLASLSPGQAHLFERFEQAARHSDLQALIDAGVLSPGREPISAILSQVGSSRLSVSAAFAEAERAIHVEEKPIVVPKRVWNTVARSAIPITVSDIREPTALSEEARYETFRRYLNSAGGVPNWDGIKRGFAFRRSFEQELDDTVANALLDRNLSDQPIVLHGAAGTGKTTALSRLAVETAQKRRQPVLFVPTRTRNLAWGDVDQYLQWTEDSGANSALVIWDGMFAEPDQYFALSQRLAARGRQVCVVGTTYQLDRPPAQSVLADSVLSTDERASLGLWLKDVVKEAGRLVSLRGANDRYWLALLYRALPPTRQSLRRAVLRDVELTEFRIQDTAPEVDDLALTSIQQAMLEVGLVREDQVSSTIQVESGDPGLFERLTSNVMVPGRFGLNPPIDLILRTTGDVQSSVLHNALSSNSVIVWYEDAVGNITLGPRNTVEAEIIVQSRLGTANAEIGIIRDLLSNIRNDASYDGDGPEVRFATELVRSFGSSSSERDRFSDHWLDLADELEELRSSRSIEAPYLMVQEANLRREWAQRNWGRLPERSLAEARKALEVAEHALARIPAETRNTRLQSMLLVEQASAAGGVLTHASGSFGAGTENGRLLQKTLDAVGDARQIDPAAYHPLDVLFWTTRNLVNEQSLTGAQAANALASVGNAFLTTDPEIFPPNQQEQFLSREYELSQLLGDQVLAKDAWDALLDLGSGAGLYLEALRRSGVRPGVRLGEVSRDNAAAGYAYLREHWHLAQRDIRNLELALNLWWLSRSGRRLLDGERIVLPFSESDWSECLALTLSIEQEGSSQRPVTVRYLRAIAQFHLHRYGAAFGTFAEVENLSEGIAGRKRIVRTYRASTSAGTPEFFTGTVASLRSDGRSGAVFVPTVGRQLPFLPRDFGWPELKQGDDIGDFHIAFNLRGATVDSPRHKIVESTLSS